MGITGTQNLHFTDGTDAVEDHSTNLEVLARQLDSRMRSHDLDLTRFSTDLPMCVMDITLPTTTNWNTQNVLDAMIRFDTVQLDTDGMANLDVLPHAMTINTPGWYQFGFYVYQAVSTFNAGSEILIEANNTVSAYSKVSLSGIPWSICTDQGNGVPGGGSLLGNGAVGDTWGFVKVAPWVSTGGQNVVTTNFARLWAYKVRDL